MSRLFERVFLTVTVAILTVAVALSTTYALTHHPKHPEPVKYDD